MTSFLGFVSTGQLQANPQTPFEQCWCDVLNLCQGFKVFIEQSSYKLFPNRLLNSDDVTCWICVDRVTTISLRPVSMWKRTSSLPAITTARQIWPSTTRWLAVMTSWRPSVKLCMGLLQFELLLFCCWLVNEWKLSGHKSICGCC